MMRNLGYNEPQATMARGSLYRAQQDAQELHRRLRDSDKLPMWVNYKLANASHDIARVKHYLDYKLTRMSPHGTAFGVLTPSNEKKLAKAIKRLAPRLKREMKSREKVKASAATQLRALLYTEPAATMSIIDKMLSNLSRTSASSMAPGQHEFISKVYLRMKHIWSRALR
jgi:hypothetical protein